MRLGTISTLVAAALLAACGGGSSSTTSNGTCTPGTTTSVGISAAGVLPKAVCVLPGGTVTFNNTDTAPHSIQATTAGTACAPLNLGPIAGNGSATTATLPSAASCPYSDGTQNAAFQGTVYVQTAPAGGPGH